MEIAVIALLIILNGFFALSEIAIVSVKRQTLEKKAKEGDKKALEVLKLLEKPEAFLSSIQVGITLIGIFSGAYGGTVLADDLRPFFEMIPFTAIYAEQLAFGIIVVILTFFSIVIGELIPKTIALNNPERFAIGVVRIIKNFTILTAPIVYFFSTSTQIITKLFGLHVRNDNDVSEEEIRYLIRAAAETGEISNEEVEIHDGIFSFLDLTAKNMMTQRSEVEWIENHSPLEVIEEKIQNSSHSKFPVCNHTMDEVIGILDVKEFFETYEEPDFELISILQKPVYFTENASGVQIIKAFKQSRQYFGVVVNEYGTFQGIITLHDLLECIVGDLPDNDEREEDEIIKRKDGSFLVSGTTLIFDLNKEVNESLIEEKPENYSTVAGFLIEKLKRIPDAGETFDFGDINIEIVDMDNNKIDRVIIKKITPPQI